MKRRLRIIRDMLNKDIFVPWVNIEHFYSPFPSKKVIRNYAFEIVPDQISSINLQTEEQINLLCDLERFYISLPFSEVKTNNLRYYYLNSYFSYSDAIFLFLMIRKLKPKKIIEVGSGYSSSVMLDTNELYQNHEIVFTFIEPYPNRLKTLLKKEDLKYVTIHEDIVQNIPLDTFRQLQDGDILFIDSSHTTKLNSDVNYIIHEILPVLSKGVYIHFHDIFYPFEYPKDWFEDGRAWNEQYILRAFLQYNHHFEIILFNSYLEKKIPDVLREKLPLTLKHRGQSIWIKKL